MNIPYPVNRSILTALVTIALCRAIVLAEHRDADGVVIHWTDAGVYFGERPEHLKRPDDFMFGRFPADVKPFRDGIDSRGQILVPMPDNDHLPKTEAEWATFERKLEHGISARIDESRKLGVKEFHVRTVQNIAMFAGYWDKGGDADHNHQQARVVDFSETFLKSLDQVRRHLANHGPVFVDGFAGSNGGVLLDGEPGSTEPQSAGLFNGYRRPRPP